MHINNPSVLTTKRPPSDGFQAETASGFSEPGKGVHLILALAALVALCLGAPVRADEQVPFKGVFDFVIGSMTSVDENHVRFDVEVHIRATHLGKALGPAFFILDINNLTYVGEAAWAGANGDSILLTFTGYFAPTSKRGIFQNVETFDVVGGTGRFENASGAATVDGFLDVTALSPVAPWPFAGTMSSPGSLKK
jgi:hypothetical protein